MWGILGDLITSGINISLWLVATLESNVQLVERYIMSGRSNYMLRVVKIKENQMEEGSIRKRWRCFEEAHDVHPACMLKGKL